MTPEKIQGQSVITRAVARESTTTLVRPGSSAIKPLLESQSILPRVVAGKSIIELETT